MTDTTLTVHVPFQVKKRGGRKLMISPDGTAEPARPQVDNSLVKALARAHRWKRLLEDRSLVPAAVEETVRFDCPVQNLGRQTTREVVVRGTTIPADSRVIVSYGAANRDPAAFEAPDEYRPGRSEKRHLGFGQGVHFCLGAGLALLEGAIAHHDGQMAATARALGLERSHLYKKAKALGLRDG